MAYADYEICPGCDGKALYMGDSEVPDGVVVWHVTCLAETWPEVGWEDLITVYEYARRFDVDEDPSMQRVRAVLGDRYPRNEGNVSLSY